MYRGLRAFTAAALVVSAFGIVPSFAQKSGGILRARRNMFPLSELDRMLTLSDTALHTAAGSERGQFPTIGLFERTRTISKEPETRRLKIVVISRGTGSSNPSLSSEESNANLMPTTFSQPAVRSLPNRLPIARSTKCPRNPSCIGRL
jgi:hypothetical protein